MQKGDWGDHLAKRPQIKAKILQTPKESVPPDMELIRRWRVLAEPGAAMKKEDFSLLGKAGAEQAMKTWQFLQDLVVSDKDQPQDRDKDPTHPHLTETVTVRTGQTRNFKNVLKTICLKVKAKS